MQIRGGTDLYEQLSNKNYKIQKMAAFKSHVASSLLNHCLENISKNLTLHQDLFDTLPPDIKSKLTKKLSMRGLLRDCHLEKLLHPRIRSLNLSSCDITDGGLAVIAEKCKSLSSLDLNAESEPRINITSNGIMVVFRSCRMLQTIHLRRCPEIDDDAVVAIATNCPHIANLNLGGCHLLSDRSICTLAKESWNLSSLNISHTQVSDVGLCALAHGVCQQNLRVSFRVPLPRKFTSRIVTQSPTRQSSIWLNAAND
ncbi:protein AMN1 homolog isoform X2 [Dendronephthya gigantea]|uniref:protein AMN1 homolog isoform X2 n=1 Tax=Dendronephthya gigantea TaxID=151771 RepID=UPI00106BE2B1|nr:protein AMN1 homolog isoform X2 [Dendronephthya gigantea]